MATFSIVKTFSKTHLETLKYKFKSRWQDCWLLLFKALRCLLLAALAFGAHQHKPDGACVTPCVTPALEKLALRAWLIHVLARRRCVAMCSCREHHSPRSCCQHKLRKQLHCSYFYKLPLCVAKVNHKLITASCLRHCSSLLATQAQGMRGIFHMPH